MIEKVTVADIMAKNLISVPKEMSISEAAEILLEKGISSVGVKDSGKIVGIVTDKDFVKAFTMDNPPKSMGDMMSKELITVGPGEYILQAARLMGKHKIRHLLVKNGEGIIGILSLRDILKIEPFAIYAYYPGRMAKQD